MAGKTLTSRISLCCEALKPHESRSLDLYYPCNVVIFTRVPKFDHAVSKEND